MLMRFESLELYVLKYKGLKQYDFNDKKDLSYIFMRIERTWAICFSLYKGLELHVSQNIKDLSYMFLKI